LEEEKEAGARLPEFDGAELGRAVVAVDDLRFDDCLHVHLAPVGGGVAQEGFEVGGVGDEFAGGFGAFFGDAGGDDDGLSGEGVAIAGDDGVVARELFVGEVPGGEPGGIGSALPVDDEGVSVDGVEAEAKIAGEAHGPEVVECADEDGGSFAELGEAGFRGGGDAKGFVASLEDATESGEGDDVGEGEESGLAEAEVERFGEFGVLDGLSGILIVAGVAGRLAEAEGDGGWSGGDGLPEVVDGLIGRGGTGNSGLAILTQPVAGGESEQQGDGDQQEGQNRVSGVVDDGRLRYCTRGRRPRRRGGVSGVAFRAGGIGDWSGRGDLSFRSLDFSQEDGDVRAGGKLDADLFVMGRVVIVLG